MSDDASADGPIRRRKPGWSRLRRIMLGLLLLLAVLATSAWLARRPIAENIIEKELAKRDVDASYTLERVGLRTQILRDLRFGPADDPDLTVKYAKVQMRVLLFGGVEIYRVEAHGIRGKLAIREDGSLDLGELDKLRPAPSGKAFTLPDLTLDVRNAQFRVASPHGPLGLTFEGNGNLRGGFVGKAGLSAPGLAFGDCRLDRLSGQFDLSVTARRPGIRGPARADSLSCRNQVALAEPRLQLDITASESFDRLYDSRLGITAASLAGGKDVRADKLRFELKAKGPIDRIEGRYRLASDGAVLALLNSGALRSEGHVRVNAKEASLLLDGDATLANAALSRATLTSLKETIGSLRKTPLEPIGQKLARAIEANLANFDSETGFSVARDGAGAIEAGVKRFALRSRAGGRIALESGQGVSFKDDRLAINGNFMMEGGGLPKAQLSVQQRGDAVGGTLRIATYQAGSARLAIPTLRFEEKAKGQFAFNGRAQLSGPLSGGQIDGLELPISGRFGPGGAIRAGEGCITARFARLQLGSLELGRNEVPICATSGAMVSGSADGIKIDLQTKALALRGEMGGNPFRLDASGGRVVGGEFFELADVDVAMGDPGAPVMLAAEAIKGTFSGPGVSGDFAGGKAVIGDVPLDFSEVQGLWTVYDGDLVIDGSMSVADRAEEPRFWPLVSENAHLTLIDGTIDARASLNHPYSGKKVLDVTLAHNLDNGVGGADLSVDRLRFGYSLQPEELTPLTQGVIALVFGQVDGTGRIDWNDGGVTSTGRFGISNASFAAPFGPVTGFNTTVNFIDLINMVSAPAQQLTVATVNPGIEVVDGTAQYQLLPGSLVKVDGARWPFVGGDLRLQPTVLNFGSDSDKRLTFEVESFNAAEFIRKLEFENIKLTGTFDGVLPMIFDEDGGRVVGGRLDSRDPGGTLEYDGAVDRAQMGMFAEMAFDTLRSLRYDSMIVRLDGELDGEFATRLDIDQVRLGESTGAKLLKSFSKVLFNFNVTITGPFRALITSAQSYDDPRLLISDVLPPQIRDIPGIETVVIRKDEDEALTQTPVEQNIELSLDPDPQEGESP